MKLGLNPERRAQEKDTESTVSNLSILSAPCQAAASPPGSSNGTSNCVHSSSNLSLLTLSQVTSRKKSTPSLIHVALEWPPVRALACSCTPSTPSERDTQLTARCVLCGACVCARCVRSLYKLTNGAVREWEEARGGALGEASGDAMAQRAPLGDLLAACSALVKQKNSTGDCSTSHAPLFCLPCSTQFTP